MQSAFYFRNSQILVKLNLFKIGKKQDDKNALNTLKFIHKILIFLFFFLYHYSSCIVTINMHFKFCSQQTIMQLKENCKYKNETISIKISRKLERTNEKNFSSILLLEFKKIL
jgi:hypothetical protein